MVIATMLVAVLLPLISQSPIKDAAIAQAKKQHVPTITTQTVAKVAIIIDDIGYSRRRGLAALALPGKVTYAIIPHSPNSQFLANEAQKKQKEIILHAPMSTIHNRPLGELGLTEKMGKHDFHYVLDKAIASVPYIRGMNNHMGSLLTQKQIPMEWIMDTLKARGLYFIDSRTTSHSVAWKTAQKYNVPSLKRDIFLDHERNTDFIHRQFLKLIAVAKRRGYAVAIAHPYPETIRYLQRHLHTLAEQGIQLVPTSQLVNTYSPNRQNIQAKM